MKKLYYLLSGLTISLLPLMEFPQTEISNGTVHAKLLLPGSENSYYQGTRFDHSGAIESLEWNGHSYFGQWFRRYSPEIHDAIMGPVEEFTPLEYDSAKPGENFVKIGVGVLTKPDDKAYSFARLYKVVNPGTWKVKSHKDKVLFTHDLKDEKYSYHYEKTVSLTKGKPELVLTHTLKNTGKTTIETSAYDHNFFMIDKQPVGTGIQLVLPKEVTGQGTGFGERVQFQGNRIVYLRDLKSNENASCYDIRGLGHGVEDYDFRIENMVTKAGVHITCDQPLEKLVFWSCSTTACPEPYITLKAEPGKEIKWTIKYEFYTF
ncbi:MAG TPA: hypothetical protein VHO68_09100 [Bacteroidales bacterium]|nr:hypothetical protein [Bacteroidales bacterium]